MLKKNFAELAKRCIFAQETSYINMDSVTYISNSRKKTMRKIAMYKSNQQIQVTPKERLHSVEEFIEKLEQAVLEKL